LRPWPRKNEMIVDFDPSRINLLSFDVFGTLISVRDGSYGAFEKILQEAAAAHVDVKTFWEAWEERNIALWGALPSLQDDLP